MIDKDQTAQQNAERMMNEKYGKGNWSKKLNNPKRPGRESDYSKIVKWIQRGGFLSSITIAFEEDEDSIHIFA